MGAAHQILCGLDGVDGLGAHLALFGAQPLTLAAEYAATIAREARRALGQAAALVDAEGGGAAGHRAQAGAVLCRDAAPGLVLVGAWGAGPVAGTLEVEMATSDAGTGVFRPAAAPQAFDVAALTPSGAGQPMGTGTHSLAVAGGPASVVGVPAEGGPGAGLAAGAQHAGTHVGALLAQLVAHDVVGPGGRLQQAPVNGGQVAELLVLLDAHGPPQHGPQRRQPHVPQVRHLVDDQRIAQEEAGPADHRQVGEEVPQALQAVDTEEEQVVRDLREAREAEAAEVLAGGREHEQDLQVTLHHAAVLQPAQLRHLRADIQAGAHV